MATRKIVAAQGDDRRRISTSNGDSPGPLIAVMIVTNGRSGLNIIESHAGLAGVRFAMALRQQATRRILARLSVATRDAMSAYASRGRARRTS
jgi:hypothetical protein